MARIFRKLFLFSAALTLAVGHVSQAMAGFTFEISPISFTGGNGIGTELAGSSPTPPPPHSASGYENGTGGGKLLGVVGTVVPTTPVSFSLPGTVGASYSFAVATYAFDAAETFITPGEASSTPSHDIGFTLDLTFLSPSVGLQNLSLTGTATVGNTKDLADDYVLTFDPVTVNFGTNDAFTISLATVGLTPGHQGLSLNGETLTLVATIAVSAVPEPTSMGLLGTGAIGMLLAAYRRRRSSANAA